MYLNGSLTSFASLCAILVSYLLMMDIAVLSYRVRHIRLCIQSVDPSKLASQCVYCRNRIFPLTVRVCTSNNYLPARMTVNEGYCLVNACRRQLPKMPPEAYQEGVNQANSIIASNSMLTPSNIDSQGPLQIIPNNNMPMIVQSGQQGLPVTAPSGSAIEPVNSDTGNDYEEAESVQAHSKTRPPARFFVGKPQKLSLFKFRPIFFG